MLLLHWASVAVKDAIRQLRAAWVNEKFPVETKMLRVFGVLTHRIHGMA